MRSFLRWAGSKRKLLPKIQPYWQDGFSRYVEPFMGSAALYFSLQPRRALLSDINDELVHAFLAVKNHPRAIHNRLQKLPLGSKSYYELRSLDPDSLSNLDRAARFIFLNRFCFNGLYRTNSSGKFNVPYSPTKTGVLPNLEKLKSISHRLKNTTILKMDYARVLRSKVREGDFVYLDPPYAVNNRRIFRQYGPQEFGTSDLAELASILPDLHSRGVRFLVSYAYNAHALDIFKQWPTRRVYSQRNIAGFVKHRRRACELLVSNVNLN